MNSLSGKVCLITGASSGIGAATAVEFARRGGLLALCGRNRSGLDATAEKCKQLGCVEVLLIEADLSKEADRLKLISETVKQFNKIDVLVNNAGTVIPGTLDKIDLMKDYDVTMEVNVKAPLHLLHLAIPYLKVSTGSVVNVSSLLSHRTVPNRITYAMSKAAIDQITRCTALELAANGIRVNAVNPGLVESAIHKRTSLNDQQVAELYEKAHVTHPLSIFTGKPCQPEDVAEAIVFFASETSRYITGVCLPVDGGRQATCLR